LNQYNNQAFTNWNTDILEPCPNCKRTFLPESLAHHLRACTQDKPLKGPLKKGGGHGGNTYLTQEQMEENIKFKETEKVRAEKLKNVGNCWKVQLERAA
jgi:hypothetical protein